MGVVAHHGCRGQGIILLIVQIDGHVKFVGHLVGLALFLFSHLFVFGVSGVISARKELPNHKQD